MPPGHRPELILVILTRPVNTEDRTEGAILKPADEDLLVGWIGSVTSEETTDIGCPIWQAAHRVVQAGWNLPLEGTEVGGDIARPSRRQHDAAYRQTRTG